MSNLINKVKDVIYGDTTNTDEGVAGPHSSHLANAADPRVDSDMDGSHHVGTTTGTTGMTGGNNYTTGTTGTAEGVAGPHSSRFANAADPRVDSDMDGSRRVGTTTGTTGMTGGNNYNTTGTAEGVAGPHQSRLANALDPRVDSDMDGSRRVGNTTGTTGMTGSSNYTTGTTGDNTYNTGTTGTTGSSGGYGPHSSSLLNKLDPRVDSTTGAMKTSSTTGTTGTTDTTGTYGTRTGVTGDNYTGTAQNTAGPHNSDLLNKLDPRVDSDMDGSGVVGGNRNYGENETKDPLNAAHVPPSVLRKSLGDPVITHDNPEHNHQGRHGSMSHQEAHLHRGSEAF